MGLKAASGWSGGVRVEKQFRAVSACSWHCDHVEMEKLESEKFYLPSE